MIFLGQAAAMGKNDITLMLGVTLLVIVAITFFYKELLVVSFDKTFAGSVGLPVAVIHYALMMLLAFSGGDRVTGGRRSAGICHADHAGRRGVFADRSDACNAAIGFHLRRCGGSDRSFIFSWQQPADRPIDGDRGVVGVRVGVPRSAAG